NLIAFRPDKRLAELFGLRSPTGSLPEGYLKIETEEDIGTGLTPETIQFHSDADLYENTAASMIATLYSDAQTETTHPAVVFNDYGAGHAVAFTYNLPKSIVYTRQGDWTK